MKTGDDVIFANFRKTKELTDPPIDLMITSPPYPMIEAHALSAVKKLSDLSSARLSSTRTKKTTSKPHSGTNFSQTKSSETETPNFTTNLRQTKGRS